MKKVTSVGMQNIKFAAPPFKAMIIVGAGKNQDLPMYFCGFIENYTAPDGSHPLLPILSDSSMADTVTGDKPHVYFSLDELRNDVGRLKKAGATILDIRNMNSLMSEYFTPWNFYH